ncbi:MAG: rRNA pseudouridine synthase, partial [Deltaproteobacteria bacterium]|nr:rRNA pseudouridine synthase [Deltaproteobacteria bacterium]
MRGARTKVLAYHKPRGVVTTHDDELGRETVYDRLRATLDASLAVEDWHAIGRLDQDTTGLLLVTNDGALVHHATQPATKVPKTYRALVKGRLDEGTLQALRDGVELSGGLGRSAPCEVLLEVHQT